MNWLCISQARRKLGVDQNPMPTVAVEDGKVRASIPEAHLARDVSEFESDTGPEQAGETLYQLGSFPQDVSERLSGYRPRRQILLNDMREQAHGEPLIVSKWIDCGSIRSPSGIRRTGLNRGTGESKDSPR